MGNLLVGTILYDYKSFDAPVCLVFVKPSEYHCFLISRPYCVNHSGVYTHSNAHPNVSFRNVIEDGHMQVTYHILLSLEPSTIKNSAA